MFRGGVGMSGGKRDGYVWGGGGCIHPARHGTWDTPPRKGPWIPPVLTPSGSHHNTYGWQADGTHPTEMLSC